MNKIIYALITLPLVLSSASGFSVFADEPTTFTGKTINLASTDDESKVDYIYGDELIKQIKGYSDTQVTSNKYIKAEVDYCAKNYRVRFDKYVGSAFNFGSVTGTYYVEGFEDEEKGFYPIDVNVDGVSYPFEEVNYQKIATIPGLNIIDSGVVTYEHRIKLNQYIANEIANAAYNAGLGEIEAQKKIDDYQLYLDYETKVVSYNQYLKDLEAYNVKLQNIISYNEDVIAYNEQLNDYNQYINIDLPAYNSNLATYLKYKEDLSTYESMASEIAAAQEKYDADIEKVDHHLNLMELFFTKFPNVEAGGTIQSYIHRDAVNQVIDESNENTLVLGGIPREAITRARDATNKLRALIDEYDTYRGSNSNEAKATRYSFYINKYQLIRLNLISLTQCLEYLFHNINVRNEMEKRGKTERYIYLLAELIYTADAFSDTSVKCYDLEYSGASSSKYYLTPDLLLDNNSVKSILGVDSGSDKTITSRPLSSYPSTPGQLYGEPPALPTSLVGKLDKDGNLIKPTEVVEPIEPKLADYGLTQADISATLKEPLLADYGLSSSDLDGNHIRYVPNPGELPPDRNDELNDLYDAVTLKQLNRFGTFEQDVTLHTSEQFLISDHLDEIKFIAVMWIKESEDAQEATVHEIAFYRAGETPELKHQIPVEALSGNEYKYFNHWVDEEGITELETISGKSINITANFEKGVLTEYPTKWVDENNQVLLENVGYNKFKPAYTDPTTGKVVTPTKEGDDTVKYVFKDFTYTSSDGNVHENVSKLPNCEEILVQDGYLIIKVNFTAIPLYKVIFEDDQGNVLNTQSGLDDGARVSFDAPTKEATDNARYEFDHWEVNGEPVDLPITVHSNITVKAVFKTINLYTITFTDGVSGHDPLLVLEKVEEGTIPVPPTGVEKGHTDNEYYQFTGWSPEISGASKDQTYVAQFTSTKIISNATIERNNGKLTITPDNGATEIDLTKFIQYIGSGYEIAPLDIKFNGVTLSLTENQVRLLYANDVCILSVSLEIDSLGEISLKVSAKNSVHALITVPFAMTATLNNLSNISARRIYADDKRVSMSINGASASFNLTVNTLYSIAEYYRVTLSELNYCTFKVNGEEIDQISGSYYKKGTEVNIETTANTGYRITKILLVDPNNNSNVIKSENSSAITFVVDQNVKVFTENEKIKYTITIYVDNYPIKSYEVEYGKIFAPEEPEKAGTDSYYWTFVGWEELDEGVKSFTVTGDFSLHALFEAITIINPSEAGQESKNLITKIFIILGIILVIGLIFVLLLVLLKKKDDDDEDDNKSKNKSNKKSGVKKHEKKN